MHAGLSNHTITRAARSGGHASRALNADYLRRMRAMMAAQGLSPEQALRQWGMAERGKLYAGYLAALTQTDA